MSPTLNLFVDLGMQQFAESFTAGSSLVENPEGLPGGLQEYRSRIATAIQSQEIGRTKWITVMPFN